MKIARMSLVVLFFGLMVLYQNCGSSPAPENPNDAIVHKLGDSASAELSNQLNVRWWIGSDSFTDHRNLDDSNSVDLFNISPSISEALSSDQNFVVLLVNGKASPSAILQFNGKSISAGDYQSLVDQYLKGNGGLTSYQLIGVSQLTGLSIVAPRVSGAFNIRTSREELVRLTEFNSNGEYCDGALVLQIVDPKNMIIDPETGLVTSGVLLEMAIYATPSDS